MYATPIDQLSPRLEDLWRGLVDARSEDFGPFLHPTFVRAVGTVRSNVEIGVLEQGGEIDGFLPFQRGRWGIARPVAGRLSDQSGAVLRHGARWDPQEFAHAARLRAIRLDHAPTDDPSLAPYQDQSKKIHVLDVSKGFDAYRAANLASGSQFMRQTDRRIRKAERLFGPMRFEWQCDDGAVLERLFAWKNAQRRRTGTPNILDLRWAQALMHRLHAIRDPEFEGVLSAVYFGDTLAAAHFGIRTRTVLQYWVPGYDPALHRQSPGLACLMAVAREGSERGVQRIDLGAGEQRFKVRACNATREVAKATVLSDATVGALISTVDGVRSWARASAGRKLIHRALRILARGTYRARSLLR